MIRFEEPPDEFKDLLERVRNYKISNRDSVLEFENENNELTKVVLELDEGEIFYYDFPRSIQQANAENQPIITMRDLQFDLTEHHWHLPTFFSLFGPDTFYKVLTAVLLERSIVFVHQNFSVISSVIMSLKALLRPFMW